uniref:E3 ubiquitin-protein ligase APD1-4 middle domain-containing protein n=1 Tax=Arion vulgaris TaxID=1028688 RepID=A0A0B7AGJ9_9EUPU
MRKGFRPLLKPLPRCRAKTEEQQPILCLTLSLLASLFVIAIFGLSAWNTYVHRFSNNVYTFHNGDEVAMSQVTSDFSSMFCDGYKVSLQGSGQAFLLPHHAAVNTSFSDDTPVAIHQLPYRELNVIYMYLLERSFVNVTACFNTAPVSPNAEMVLIQGDGNFKTWRRKRFCSNCVLKRTKIPHNAFCGDSGQMPSLYYDVKSNDAYFLVVFDVRPGPKRHFIHDGIFLRGVVSRTHFDLSNTEQICHIVNGSSCFFLLPWMSTKDVVIKFDGPSWNSYHNTVTTHCQIRQFFFICLFGILPFVCIFLILVLFCCFLRRRAANNTKMISNYNEGNNGERMRLLPDNQFKKSSSSK